MLDKLNFNKYGFMFDTFVICDETMAYVNIINQEEQHSRMIRRLEPDMPFGCNNILLWTDSPDDCWINVPYKIKYLCI